MKVMLNRYSIITMTRNETELLEERILVLAPLGRDAALLCDTLEGVGMSSLACTEAMLRTEVSRGLGALLLTEEALTQTTVVWVRSLLTQQPDWSDLQVVLLLNKASFNPLAPAGPAAIILLERPTRMTTLVTVLHNALLARRRQYQVRALLDQQQQANARLEAIVAERTASLLKANTRLKEEIAEHQLESQNLLLSERRFEKAFRLGPVAASITTLDGRQFIDVNQSFLALTGYLYEEIIGNPKPKLSLWRSVDDQVKLLQTLRTGGELSDVEFDLQTKRGDVRTVHASVTTIEIENATYALSMFYDVTEQRQLDDDLLGAINEVMQDTAWFSRSLMEKLAQARARRSGRPVSAHAFVELTRRERQVVVQLAKGQRNPVIARELGVTEQTVRNYITTIYEKIGVHSRAEAVVWARERGLAGF